MQQHWQQHKRGPGEEGDYQIEKAENVHRGNGDPEQQQSHFLKGQRSLAQRRRTGRTPPTAQQLRSHRLHAAVLAAAASVPEQLAVLPAAATAAAAASPPGAIPPLPAAVSAK